MEPANDYKAVTLGTLFENLISEYKENPESCCTYPGSWVTNEVLEFSCEEHGCMLEEVSYVFEKEPSLIKVSELDLGIESGFVNFVSLVIQYQLTQAGVIVDNPDGTVTIKIKKLKKLKKFAFTEG